MYKSELINGLRVFINATERSTLDDYDKRTRSIAGDLVERLVNFDESTIKEIIIKESVRSETAITMGAGPCPCCNRG